MRVYTVHGLPGADPIDNPPVLVREGFSWLAAILTFLWALWHGMWLAALLIFVIGAALQVGLGAIGADGTVQALAGIGLSLVVGFCGQDWRRAKIARRGLRLEGVVAAGDVDSAQRRWFDLHPPGRPTAFASG